jgi:RNA polymerase sigma-70 factor (ECF subfamily)
MRRVTMTTARADYEQDRRDAFEEEALPWIDSVYRFALSMTHDPADAEDVVQDTFLRAFCMWHDYEPGSDCRRWLFTICRNAFLRSRERRPMTMELTSMTEEVGAALAAHASDRWKCGADPAEARLAHVDLGDAIDRALSQVPEPYRSALILVDVEDQSYDSAARALHVPLGTLRSRVFRGRRLMQVLLGAYARDLGVSATSPTPSSQRVEVAS